MDKLNALRSRVRDALIRLEAGTLAGEKPEPYDFYKAVQNDGPGWNYQCIGLGISDLREIVEVFENHEAINVSAIGTAVQTERRRCAKICERAAVILEDNAKQIRKNGTFGHALLYVRRKNVVHPTWEKYAVMKDNAARLFRTAKLLILSGR